MDAEIWPITIVPGRGAVLDAQAKNSELPRARTHPTIFAPAVSSIALPISTPTKNTAVA